MSSYTILLDLLAFGSILSGVLVITSRNPVISVLFLIAVFVNVAGYLLLSGISFIGITYLIIYVGAIAILFLFVVMMMNIKLVELTSVGQEYTKNLPLGAIVGSLFFFELLILAPINLGDVKSSMLGGSSLELLNTLFNKVNLLQLSNSSLHNTENTQHIYDLANINGKFQSNELDQEGIINDFQGILWDNKIVSFQQIESIGHSIYTIYTIWFIVGSAILLLAMIGPIILCLKSASTTARS